MTIVSRRNCEISAQCSVSVLRKAEQMQLSRRRQQLISIINERTTFMTVRPPTSTWKSWKFVWRKILLKIFLLFWSNLIKRYMLVNGLYVIYENKGCHRSIIFLSHLFTLRSGWPSSNQINQIHLKFASQSAWAPEVLQGFSKNICLAGLHKSMFWELWKFSKARDDS